jgi:hypothetical protein
VQNVVLEPGKIPAVSVDTVRIFPGEKQVLRNFDCLSSLVSWCDDYSQTSINKKELLEKEAQNNLS